MQPLEVDPEWLQHLKRSSCSNSLHRKPLTFATQSSFLGASWSTDPYSSKRLKTILTRGGYGMPAISKMNRFVAIALH